MSPPIARSRAIGGSRGSKHSQTDAGGLAGGAGVCVRRIQRRAEHSLPSEVT
jgi:hypothetical protein